MKQFLAVFILVAIFITSCSNKITVPLTNTMNTEQMHHKWRVSQMHGAGDPLPDIYLDLRDILKTHAFNGCDSIVFTPKYFYNNRVDFSNISVVHRKCNGVPNNLFLKNLESVYYFSAGVNQLSLLNKDHEKIFEAVYDATDEQGSLLRRWEIVKMMNADEEKLLQSKSYIDFTNPDNGAAYVGCNQFSFPVKLAGKFEISIGNAASTKKYCEGDVNDEVLSKILPLIKMQQVVGNTLKLFDKDNALLIEAVSTLQ